MLGDTITYDFTTHNPTTGQLQDADFLPTCAIFVEDSDTPMMTPVPIRRVGYPGTYKVTFVASAANGFAGSLSYNLDVIATVKGVQATSRIAEFSLSVVPAVPVQFQI
jgi:hypothetical protein